ncbi:hypothetical protein DICVIV_10646 [Dictyocaulus viviparus]|uniref:Uncharacterized protein n=1 Tax=Dictyocaulus viviparus TaxID=29172 RepID=A0A0D8XHU1_DICVI|nr:hypothetical protein DICVIV_10646 [Dictyocaulus viviparus]
MSHNDSKHARMCSLLNRKRKVVMEVKKVVHSKPGSSLEKDETAEVSEQVDQKYEEDKRKAKELILREARRSKQRAELIGPQGWLRPKSLNTNKQFLHRTLAATLPDRRLKTQKSSNDP